jgi:type IV pilus assembly protein PilP
MKLYRLDRLKLLITVTTTLISACSQNYDDLYSYVDQTKSTYVGSVTPIPQFKPYESFAYSAADQRDPFVANVEVDQKSSEGGGLTPDSDRPKQPLEAFSLDSLRMVGIMEQNDSLWGLIKDSQNTVHRVQIGNYMGQNEGRITEITESGIQLVEIIPDGLGGYIERDASIAIGND